MRIANYAIEQDPQSGGWYYDPAGSSIDQFPKTMDELDRSNLFGPFASELEAYKFAADDMDEMLEEQGGVKC